MRNYLRRSFILNFVVSFVSHHYFLILVMYYNFSQSLPFNFMLLMPFACKSLFKVNVITGLGLESVKGVVLVCMRLWRIPSFNQASFFGMKSINLLALGFVNGFGYLLPTLYLLLKTKITIYDYLF